MCLELRLSYRRDNQNLKWKISLWSLIEWSYLLRTLNWNRSFRISAFYNACFWDNREQLLVFFFTFTIGQALYWRKFDKYFQFFFLIERPTIKSLQCNFRVNNRLRLLNHLLVMLLVNHSFWLHSDYLLVSKYSISSLLGLIAETASST